MNSTNTASALLIIPMIFSLNLFAQDLPRPEHPRPDFERNSWLNLNGTWQFEIDCNNTGFERGLISGKDLKDKIVVPFCPESKLSGIGNTDFMPYVWYRRFFDLPEKTQGKRILLHFGAVDWYAKVWINNNFAGEHKGGSSPFTLEITKFIKDTNNEIVVHVYDDVRTGLQAGGKQSPQRESQGCSYTRTTGIWQTVWLEAVSPTYIQDFKIIPDPDNSQIIMNFKIEGNYQGCKITATALADNKKVGNVTINANWTNSPMVLKLSKKKLWNVGNPFLYDLKIELKKGNETIDTVKSYFGLRKITIQGRAILINEKPVFQRTVLDQGFYPDGIWTAPTDSDLKRDIELSMAAGFNGARLHQKVFEPRFHYWADKLGYLTWGEYPNWVLAYDKTDIDSVVVTEWTEILERDKNHPSIIGWCPFNETPISAKRIQQIIVPLTKSIDPTRVVLETSGWTHTIANPQVLDGHDYDQNPETFKQRWTDYFKSDNSKLPNHDNIPQTRNCPLFISEYGGIGWFKKGDPAWGYGNNPETLEQFYQRYKGLTDALLDNPNIFGFCYTQLTDIEQEKNGIYYYDRTCKFEAEKLREINSRTAAYEKIYP
ncbi:MAG TPA: glycoside hydrolase family 2 TIM barrel-domain containing protein [Sedimentisphaerales bacterium]|nr:glycoside hydrolase family 2 TIM barrel-domain containing protein [Sedimentisphaerales bacterium]